MIKVPFFAPRNIRREFSEFFLVNSSISAKGQQIRNPLSFRNEDALEQKSFNSFSGIKASRVQILCIFL